jgi:hypothetical protein
MGDKHCCTSGEGNPYLCPKDLSLQSSRFCEFRSMPTHKLLETDWHLEAILPS